MTSKIFTGDMPEIMENILNNLNNEFNSLYSCALVNRHWCKMSIPILWQDPFSFSFVRTPLFISGYFSSLCEDEKSSLKNYGIDAEHSKTLFEYARYLKVLDLYSLEKVKILMPVGSINDALMNLIINLLFKLFIESGATLDKLVVYFPDYLILKPEIFCSLGQNEQFFSRLRYLSLSEVAFSSIESATTLLRTLAKNATKIRALKLEEFGSVYEHYEPQLFHALFHAIIQIIKSQEQLRLFSLIGVNCLSEFYGIISALESQKNSLQEVIIDNCDFTTEFEILKYCKNLETLRIKYCDMKLLKILSYKINTLEVVGVQSDGSIIAQILEMSGILLKRLKLDSRISVREESSILEALKSFCPNITYLDISRIGFSAHLLELYKNFSNSHYGALLTYQKN
ncbi:hypothetical protein F8M41_008626 [Gigaspora margarita]|uniref:F-box domain-containing protein n=1 Tax=Gigaspora margarita TaxID=4874 RepID=A0A8H3X526_GIGMA|nr:hypothetical protein F8M41_008626 [Gigaspora margarita]